MRSLRRSLFLAVWGSFLLASAIYAEEVENIARNPSFEDDVVEWQLLVTAPAAASWEVEDEGVSGQCVHITVDNVTGTDWHIEIHQGGQTLEKDQQYTFSVWAKTVDVPSQPLGTGMEGIGVSDWWNTVNITEEWKEYSRTWVQSVSGSGTIHFGLGFVKG